MKEGDLVQNESGEIGIILYRYKSLDRYIVYWVVEQCAKGYWHSNLWRIT